MEAVDPALVLTALFVAVAVLYSSVGHAGASGYLAAMALLGVSQQTMRPTALALNILVAGIVTLRFARADLVAWRAPVPFLVGSVPPPFVGGALALPNEVYRPLVAVALVAAAFRLAATARREVDTPRPPNVPTVPAAGVGGVIGFLAGLTGTGGGIFLSPILIFARWADTRTASGITAAFILANSISGLAGNAASVRSLPSELPLWLGAVAIAAVVGTELGTRRVRTPGLRVALAAVLIIAAAKLVCVG